MFSYLVDQVAPGNRVRIVGVFSIKKLFQKNRKGGGDKTLSGIRQPYLRVMGIHVEMSGPGRTEFGRFSPEEERQFRYLYSFYRRPRELAKRADVYDVISSSIAPSIYGSEDIKKSIACLLFGGSRKM